MYVTNFVIMLGIEIYSRVVTSAILSMGLGDKYMILEDVNLVDPLGEQIGCLSDKSNQL